MMFFQRLTVVCFCLICLSLCVHAQSPSDANCCIEGTLLMLDDSTPHVAVVVEAVIPTLNDQEQPLLAATTLSDEFGKYRLVDLQTGQYHVRCYTGQYRYYQQNANMPRGTLLTLEQGTVLADISFRFPPFRKGTWRHYTPLDGLAHNTVIRIAMDVQGYMWLGTDGAGMSRFDGETFRNLTPTDLGVSSASVWSIYHDLDGTMLFGVLGKNVYRYDGARFAPFGEEALKNVFAILWMKRDSRGVLWIGTYNGVYRYAEDVFTHFTAEDGLAGNAISAMHEASDGALWFLAEHGTSRYDGNTFVNHTLEHTFVEHAEAFVNLDNDTSMNLHRAPDGSLWYAPRVLPGIEPFVLAVHGEKSVRFPLRQPQPYKRMMGIQSTSDGAVWYGTRGEGLSCYDGTGFVYFTSQDGPLSDSVQHLVVDTDDVLWIGSGSSIENYTRGGLSRYDPHTFINFTTRDGLPSNAIAALHRSHDGMLWIGTLDGGLSRYDGKAFLNVSMDDGLVSKAITIIKEDSTGVLWLGTGGVFLEGKGVSRYDMQQQRCLEPLTVEHGLAGNTVYDIYAAPDGVVWLGTEAGLSRYDTTTGAFLETLNSKNGLVDDAVLGVTCAPTGRMWFITAPSYLQGGRGHVTRYDGRVSVHYSLAEGGLAHLMADFHSDEDKVVWLRHWCYDGETFVNLNQQERMANSPGRTVHPQLRAVDRDALVCVGTDSNGVLLYDGATWSSLDTRDGLAGNTVTTILGDGDGSLWFGTKDGGLTHYRRTTSRPKVRIASVTTDRTYQDLVDLPEFSTGTRITIAYNAIDTKTIREKRQYRWRIMRRGKAVADYQPSTQKTSFDWIAQKVGTYTFEVQTIDRDLNYSEPASVVLTVVHPFYLRAAFLVPTAGGGSIVLIVAIVASVVAIRRRREVHAYERYAAQELQDARQMQLSLLPEHAPVIEGAEIAGKCVTANTVGGDFFAYLPGEHRQAIGLLVADISGKAMRGAMNAVMTDGIVHSVIKDKSSFSPETLLQDINDVLTFRMENDMNVTMVIVLLDTTAMTLTLANAAHHAYPLLLRNGRTTPLRAKGLPLGVKAGIQYHEETFELQSGDILVLMTDGIIEAHDAEGRLYDESERLEQLLTGFTGDMVAEDIADAVINDVVEFSGNQQEDDMTVVVAKLGDVA